MYAKKQNKTKNIYEALTFLENIMPDLLPNT